MSDFLEASKRKLAEAGSESQSDSSNSKKQKTEVDLEELKAQITKSIEAKYEARIKSLEDTIAQLTKEKEDILLDNSHNGASKVESPKSESRSVPLSNVPSLKRTETAVDSPEVKHKFGASSFTFLKSQNTPLSSFTNGKSAETTPASTSKPTFGSTSTFGSAFEPGKPKKNVFDSLPSFGSNLSPQQKEEKLFGSTFGSKANFGNAFQKAMSKKSFLDEQPQEKDDQSVERETTAASTSTQQYKQVDLAPVERFTGEEDEDTLVTTNAKLFELDFTNVSKGWMERGVGHLRLNQSKSDPKAVRLLMRSQALLKVILNMKVTAKTELLKGMESSLNPGKYLRFNSLSLAGTPIQYLLKFGSQGQRDELIGKIEMLQALL